jgi:NAD(P)-dependent dehydrogenase (short-subunit alcohol dehydrogenase family)
VSDVRPSRQDRDRPTAWPAAATFVSGDVTTSEGVEGIATKALAALGGLDILVNNAGGARAFLAGSWTIPDKEWHDAFALNLFAAIRLTNAVLPALRASKAAAVVDISSAAATMPFGAFAHYGAAKAALNYYAHARGGTRAERHPCERRVARRHLDDGFPGV